MSQSRPEDDTSPVFQRVLNTPQELTSEIAEGELDAIERVLDAAHRVLQKEGVAPEDLEGFEDLGNGSEEQE